MKGACQPKLWLTSYGSNAQWPWGKNKTRASLFGWLTFKKNRNPSANKRTNGPDSQVALAFCSVTVAIGFWGKVPGKERWQLAIQGATGQLALTAFRAPGSSPSGPATRTGTSSELALWLFGGQRLNFSCALCLVDVGFGEQTFSNCGS